MMISPEAYYLELKGKTPDELQTCIRSLKQQIGSLKNRMENPEFKSDLICPSEQGMKKTVFLLSTIAIMLIISRFIIRIVDATVQIDNDVGLLLLLLVLVNAAIGFISYKLYRRSK